MRLTWPLCVVVCALLCPASRSFAYIEVGYTLGKVCTESINIVLAEVTRIDTEKNLILYKKLRDLKGQFPDGPIKHNIGQRGFHPREPQNIMAWAKIGKKAVIFSNNEASETCIDFYWYQCAKEGEWWSLNHAEPYLLRTYCGTVDQLLPAVINIMQQREVIVTAMDDGNKEKLHVREGKLIRMRASLKLQEYDPKRDLVSVIGVFAAPTGPATRPAAVARVDPVKAPVVHKETPPEVIVNPNPPVPPRPLPASIVVDKEKRTVTIPCYVAQRKLDYLSEIYPIEVIATYPHPLGRKAHETVVTFKDIKPSDVHIALQQLGLQPGRPTQGDGKPAGPLLRVYLDMPDNGTRVPMEKVLLNPATGQRIAPVNWRFTGSNFRQPDPEKDERVYGADTTGTLITLFPVTDDCVIQTDLTHKDMSTMKLETNPDLMPREGTPLKLVIEAR
ncbi:MAG: YdjY domain-containing protein [Tepidisphaerales bacterium]